MARSHNDADQSRAGDSFAEAEPVSTTRLCAEAIGRCWSQGRFLAWLADS